jgi:hypothetical protein
MHNINASNARLATTASERVFRQKAFLVKQLRTFDTREDQLRVYKIDDGLVVRWNQSQVVILQIQAGVDQIFVLRDPRDV